jgi:hypothetical protein
MRPKLKTFKTKVHKEYEICRCLVTNIQSITGHKTHDILAFISSVAEKCIEENKLDLSNFDEDDRYVINDYTYYPNTKVYFGVSVTKNSQEDYRDNSDYRYHVNIKYKFYVPKTVKKLTQEQFDDIVIDAMLTDFSMDFDPPAIRKTKTLVEQQAEKEERERREKDREVRYHKKELKVSLKEALKYKKIVDELSKIQRPNSEVKVELRNNRHQLKYHNNIINNALYELKELGDKTHEVLLTPTDSIKS